MPHVDAAAVAAPSYSADGTAAQVVVPIASSDGEQIQPAVADIRDVVADPPAGLTALVGGQGGILGDFIKAFGAIDGILLVVALLVVLVILLVVYRTIILPLVVMLSAVLGARGRLGGDLRAGQARRARPERAEPGHPVHPGAGRGDRLLAAARLPLPGGAARRGVEVRRHAPRLPPRRSSRSSPPASR